MMFSRSAIPRVTKASALLLLGFAMTATPGMAQRGSGLAVSLSVPATTQTVLNGGDGIVWDAFRKNGLVLSASGSGEVSLVMNVLTVQDGRVANRWTSSSFTVSPGKMPVSGRYLPAVQKDIPVGAVSGSSQPMDVDVLLSAAKAGNLVDMLPRDAQTGTALVIFAAPAGDLPGSRTGWLVANLEKVIDR
jgi:hypothetical protein